MRTILLCVTVMATVVVIGGFAFVKRVDDGFILDSLGWVYYKMKRYDQAVYQLERAVQLVDEDATVLGHLADAYFANREYRKALSRYRRVLQLEPDRQDIAEKIKKILAETGEK